MAATMTLTVRLDAGGALLSITERRAATALVRRYASRRGVFIPGARPDAVTLRTLGGGRSAARVYSVRAQHGGAQSVPARPVVLKILPRSEGLRERANYLRHVRTMLPRTSRPELLGFGLTRTHVALWYSFIGNPDGSRARTLTEQLQLGGIGTLHTVVDRFLELARQTWYSPAAQAHGRDISRAYLERYFSRARSVARSEAVLRACAARYFRAQYTRGCYVGREHAFPSPRALLFGAGPGRPYLSCVLHGDLNSDNLLLGSHGRDLTLIDFQKTGRGHVYEDLVALEASVRINHPRDAGFAEILEMERRIALGLRPHRGDAYSRAILAVREAALRTFGQHEMDATYHYAVAAIGLRLMHAGDLTHAARARIVASTLWSAKILGGAPVRG